MSRSSRKNVKHSLPSLRIFQLSLLRNWSFAVENNLERIKIINTGVKAFTRCENKAGLQHYSTFDQLKGQ
jgi:hypothetical protein